MPERISVVPKTWPLKEARELAKTTKHKYQWKEGRKKKREYRESKLLRLTNTEIF